MIAVKNQSGHVFLFGKRLDCTSFFHYCFYVENDSNSLFSFIKLILIFKI
ncbi:hypothetical protein C1A50_2421 [Paenibacillus polymyxa]|nr:hypothetical protein C1A50_2421 [Paenibacillus polymyxa]